MKKRMQQIFLLLLVFLTVFILDGRGAAAENNISETNIGLDNGDKSNAFPFDMPKNGKIKLNIRIRDTDTVPGSLTFAIQTGYSKDSTKIKEITGITSAQGVTDMEIELSKGQYYFYYELNNATGDFSITSLFYIVKQR